MPKSWLRLFSIDSVADAAKITTGGLSGATQIDGARSSLAMLRDIKDFQHAIGAPERAPFPVIVAVHGLVLGLGIDIIAACDVRYAAESSQFSIKVRFTRHVLH